MPRTKVVKKNTAVQEPDENEVNIRCLLQHVQNKKKELLAKVAEERKKLIAVVNTFTNEQKCAIPFKYMNMTIREIIDSEVQESTESSCVSQDILNITKSVRKGRRTVKRSASSADDEGGHKSRSKTKAAPSTRKTRSLSRTNTLKVPAPFKTPANTTTSSNSYGLVTPKCKPNTPQVLLRRPKVGEVALSMQGSPLYTASVVSENMANINIPLIDGRLLTLQPRRGLRVSQIPQFDPETLRQLETLRENLSKVCAASTVRSNEK